MTIKRHYRATFAGLTSMGHRTTVERPITDKQRRVYEAALNNPGKPRAALARDLGVSREYIKQVLAVVQTKMLHQSAQEILG